MKKGADWISWTMQFVAGFVVGCMFGLVAISRRRGRPLLDLDHSELIVIGAGLILAAYASHIGDRIWNRGSNTYHTIPTIPDMTHSPTSKTLSVLSGILGLALIIIALICGKTK